MLFMFFLSLVACHGVLVDGRLCVLNGLQAIGVGLVSTVNHLQIHVELGCHDLGVSINGVYPIAG